jgi:heme exporter protein C
MRWVFYPSVLAFLGLAWLLYTQRVRLAWLREVVRAPDGAPAPTSTPHR